MLGLAQGFNLQGTQSFITRNYFAKFSYIYESLIMTLHFLFNLPLKDPVDVFLTLLIKGPSLSSNYVLSHSEISPQNG